MSQSSPPVPEPVLPPLEEVAALVPAPGSVTWRRASDARALAAAGYALLLQVAHPVVGAGVSEHSNFERDPWGRLLRTLDYTTVMVYGGAEAAAAMGRRLIAMHRRITGTLASGEPYSALEPEPYAWVHATLADAIVRANARFGRALSDAETEAFYAEWLAIGRVIGVAERQLPPSWAEFGPYFDRMVAERLTHTEAVDQVLRAVERPERPPLPALGDALWRGARLPLARLFKLATVGLLPAQLRERLGLSWSRGRDAELRALAAVSRAATPLLPRSLRCFGPAYLRWRSERGGGHAIAGPPPRQVRVG